MGLPAILLGVAGVAAGLQVLGQVGAAKERAASDNANATIVRQNASQARDQADLERQQAAIDAENYRRQARREQGGRISAISASGITMSGSALDVLADAAAVSEQNRLTILYQGEQRARSLLQEGNIYNAQASEFERQAEAERQGGTIQAVGTALSAGASIGYGASLIPRTGAGYGSGTSFLSGSGRGTVTPISRVT